MFAPWTYGQRNAGLPRGSLNPAKECLHASPYLDVNVTGGILHLACENPGSWHKHPTALLPKLSWSELDAVVFTKYRNARFHGASPSTSLLRI